MYFEDDLTSLTGATSDAQSDGFNELVGPTEEHLCFIKYVLCERYVQVLPVRKLVTVPTATVTPKFGVAAAQPRPCSFHPTITFGRRPIVPRPCLGIGR